MRAFLGFITFVIAVACALVFGSGLALYFGWNFYIAMGAVFLAAYMAVSALFGFVGSVLMQSGGGIWSTSVMRWIVGKFAQGLLLIGALLFVDVALGWLGFTPAIYWKLLQLAFPDPLRLLAFLESQSWGELVRLYIAVALLGGIPAYLEPGRWLIAKATLPVRRVWRSLKAGVGGSESFMGLMDEWLMPWKPGYVMLGTSLYEPGRKIGRPDNRHQITIATTRSGKGRSSILTNLLLWPADASALVIDPKGENAAVTAPARRKKGSAVFILDPFRVLHGELGLSPHAYPVHRFNPLDSIKLDDLDVVEQIGNLADALIIHSEHGNPFWDNAAKAVLVGMIAHVVSWPGLKPEERHLGTVRDYVAKVQGRDLRKDAGRYASPGNLAEIAVATLEQSSDDAGGDILTTLSVHVKWLDSIAMREALSASDFKLADLKGGKATLYMILPPKYLKEHARFLRLFVTLALHAAGGVKAKHPMLFILDEFAHLGPLKAVEEAASLMAGSGVKLWPFIQSITQLRMYGDNWEVFLSQAGTIQVFAMNDQATAEYFSKRLGHHIAWRRVRAGNNPRTGQPEYEWTPQGATFLRTTPELSRESSRDSGRALLFFEGGTAGLVRRANYDRIFKATEFSPNPYEKPRGVRGRWGEIRRAWESEEIFDTAFSWVEGLLRGKNPGQYVRDSRAEMEEMYAQDRRLEAGLPAIALPHADLKMMSTAELEAERKKIEAEVTADPRMVNYPKFTPKEKAKWHVDFKPQMDRFVAVEKELAGRSTLEQAAAAEPDVPQAQVLLDAESEIAREAEGQGVRPAEGIETPAMKKTAARKAAQKKPRAQRAPKQPKMDETTSEAHATADALLQEWEKDWEAGLREAQKKPER
jgi:Type IV secretory system Conjugative DNA transfer